jgi:exodeoxyribonuclease VII small subunit
MAKPKQELNYQELKDELDEIMILLQQEDLDVDKALEHYKRGLQLVQQLESYLKDAENKITEIKAKFSGQ